MLSGDPLDKNQILLKDKYINKHWLELVTHFQDKNGALKETQIVSQLECLLICKETNQTT